MDGSDPNHSLYRHGVTCYQRADASLKASVIMSVYSESGRYSKSAVRLRLEKSPCSPDSAYPMSAFHLKGYPQLHYIYLPYKTTGLLSIMISRYLVQAKNSSFPSSQGPPVAVSSEC